MILKKLTIYNFRSYYGKNEFEFSNRLNLILGANGDGKTTFFDALNWVLTPDYAPKDPEDAIPENRTLVSAKMFSELAQGQRSVVKVVLILSNNEGSVRTVERGFFVTKGAGDKMEITNNHHDAYVGVGPTARKMLSLRSLFEEENVFPMVIKKYHIFKGEEKLNIFNDKSTLKNLIDMFSEIRDLDPYKQFAEYAVETSSAKLDMYQSNKSKSDSKILSLQSEQHQLNLKKERIHARLDKARIRLKEAEDNIESIGKDYQIIKEIASLNEKENQLVREIERLKDKIDNEYSYKLLDDQWILMGFQPILDDFNRKMSSLSMSKENIEADYKKKQEDEFTKNKVVEVKSEFAKIAWSQKDISNMNYSLRTQHCVYCGSPIQKGSDIYKKMEERINEVIDLLSPKKEVERPAIKRYFKFRNVENLKEMGLSLKYTGKDISTIPDEIESLITENDKIQELIDKKDHEIDDIKSKVASLYASSKSGHNLKEYVDNISKVNQWHDQKQEASLEIDRIMKIELPAINDAITKNNSSIQKESKNGKGNPMFAVNEFFRVLSAAIDETQTDSYDEFLKRLGEEANKYLALLNVDDFTGIIKIYFDDHTGQPMVRLQDKNGQYLTNPNTSLLTTMYISVLFAISELTKENRDAEYPLIFDAPTSSFDEGKDKTFYECLNTQVDKQCIVVTKSFLYKNEAGEYVVDKDSLEQLNCSKYRIHKVSGFDKLDLSTIDTTVEKID